MSGYPVAVYKPAYAKGHADQSSIAHHPYLSMSYNSYPGNSFPNAGALNAPQMPGYPPQSGYPGASHSSYPGQQPSYAPPPGPPGPPTHQHSSSHSAPPASSAGASNVQTNGNYDGVQYTISYRDSNSILSLRLQPGYEIKGKPGSMVAMDASVKIKGKVSYRDLLLLWRILTVS